MNLFNIATEKSIGGNGDVFIAQPLEDFIPAKKGCLNFSDSFRFLTAGLDGSSTTITSFPTLDASGMEN